MEAIATEADVAVQTLYFSFGTKGALLGETLGASVVGFDRWERPIPESAPVVEESKRVMPWFAAVESSPSGAKALARFVAGTVDVLERSSPLVRALHEAAQDPEARAVKAASESRRLEAYREVVRLLSRKGGLRDKLTAPRATDVLFVVLSPETYDALVRRGWSKAQCKRWLTETLTRELLPDGL